MSRKCVKAVRMEHTGIFSYCVQVLVDPANNSNKRFYKIQAKLYGNTVVCVCVCAYVRACVRACVCVCVRERQRDRETDRQTDIERESACVRA